MGFVEDAFRCLGRLRKDDRSALRWQPIATALKDGTELLLTDGHYTRTGYWATRVGAWSMDATVPLTMPTHWARLPTDAAPDDQGRT